MSTLFTDEKPKPYGEYPSRDAYIVLLFLGLIPFACFATAPLFAYKYPGGGWPLGLWASAPMLVIFGLTELSKYGFIAGLLGFVLNPVVWAIAIACCVAAAVAARKGRPRESAE
jgi:hypothetical protein